MAYTNLEIQAEAAPLAAGTADLVGGITSGLYDFYMRLLVFDCRLVKGVCTHDQGFVSSLLYPDPFFSGSHNRKAQPYARGNFSYIIILQEQQVFDPEERTKSPYLRSLCIVSLGIH